MARHTTPCIHRWVLGEPELRLIQAVCRRCGAHRTYPSGLESEEFDSDLANLEVAAPELAKDLAEAREHALV